MPTSHSRPSLPPCTGWEDLYLQLSHSPRGSCSGVDTGPAWCALLLWAQEEPTSLQPLPSFMGSSRPHLAGLPDVCSGGLKLSSSLPPSSPRQRSVGPGRVPGCAVHLLRSLCSRAGGMLVLAPRNPEGPDVPILPKGAAESFCNPFPPLAPGVFCSPSLPAQLSCHALRAYLSWALPPLPAQCVQSEVTSARSSWNLAAYTLTGYRAG